MNDLPVIQKTYDLIKYYIPILNHLPRNHKFALGDRIIAELYNLLEELITAQYSANKLSLLKALNGKLSVLRYQTRLLYDFELIGTKRYQYVMQYLNEIGKHLGRWIKHQSKNQ
ncbi:diversity-generating retroelement protein Avd [Candidatus Parabeggiatoa sp. HSG14]|uniref:diversity-generating retroelement protein Avd n=1 Tax=Candidatus Parabeggiatoa sp. HSG14 TaxID=3055593 RepID=UPI0025A86937|nr:diversity-generating retroelement protein Avd [Thiotrichales bacterium HSG14]